MYEKNKIGWNFDNSYSNLPKSFIYQISPVPVKQPELVILNYGLANKMTENEKIVSFYNNYFIFKKVRTVNSESVYNAIIENKIIIEKPDNNPVYNEEVIEIVNEIEKIKPKKTKKKVKLIISS